MRGCSVLVNEGQLSVSVVEGGAKQKYLPASHKKLQNFRVSAGPVADASLRQLFSLEPHAAAAEVHSRVCLLLDACCAFLPKLRTVVLIMSCRWVAWLLWACEPLFVDYSDEITVFIMFVIAHVYLPPSLCNLHASDELFGAKETNPSSLSLPSSSLARVAASTLARVQTRSTSTLRQQAHTAQTTAADVAGNYWRLVYCPEVVIERTHLCRVRYIAERYKILHMYTGENIFCRWGFMLYSLCSLPALPKSHLGLLGPCKSQFVFALSIYRRDPIFLARDLRLEA